jgi:hypothetical protein
LILMHPQSSSTWVDQSDAVELIYQALCTMFGADLANLLIGRGASGNRRPRPLAGLDREQLYDVTDQLEEMAIEIRQTLDPEAQLKFEVALDGALVIVADEMREKAGESV